MFYIYIFYIVFIINPAFDFVFRELKFIYLRKK